MAAKRALARLLSAVLVALSSFFGLVASGCHVQNVYGPPPMDPDINEIEDVYGPPPGE